MGATTRQCVQHDLQVRPQSAWYAARQGRDLGESVVERKGREVKVLLMKKPLLKKEVLPFNVSTRKVRNHTSHYSGVFVEVGPGRPNSVLKIGGGESKCWLSCAEA